MIIIKKTHVPEENDLLKLIYFYLNTLNIMIRN
jgi:hypothetical protein